MAKLDMEFFFWITNDFIKKRGKERNTTIRGTRPLLRDIQHYIRDTNII